MDTKIEFSTHLSAQYDTTLCL